MAQGPRSVRTAIGSFLSLERNVLVMSLTALLINFGFYTFQPFIPLYLRTLNANITDIGIVFVAMQVAATVAAIPGGLLADRLGRKSVIVMGNAVGFGLYLALVGVNYWPVALLILFAATIFSTLVQPAASSTVAESVRMHDRSSAFGTFLLFTDLGLALGAALGGYFSFTLSILFLGIAGIAAAFIRLGLLKETLPKELRSERPSSRKPLFIVNLTRNVWLYLLVLVIFNFSVGLGQPIYAIFSTDILNLSKVQLGVMVSLGYVAAILSSFMAGRLAKKTGVANMMGMGVIVSSLILVPWLYSPNAFVAIALFALSGFFAQFFFVANQALIANITRAEERGSIIGFVITAAGAGSIVGPYVGSVLWVLLDPRSPFLISALLGIAIATPLIWIREPRAARHCPHCGREVEEQARFCDLCGKLIRYKKCYGCGRDLEESARFCDICGRDQPKETKT